MSVKSDRWIRRMVEKHRMIEPFAPDQVREIDGRLPGRQWRRRMPSTDTGGLLRGPLAGLGRRRGVCRIGRHDTSVYGRLLGSSRLIRTK